MTEWQPIESAPQDGRWIIGAYFSTRHPHLNCVRNVRWQGKKHCKGWKNAECESNETYVMTHWMPLELPSGFEVQ